MNPFQSVITNTSSPTATMESIPLARSSFTPQEVAAAYAVLVGGIKADTYSQPSGHVGSSTELATYAGEATLAPNKMPTRAPLSGGTYAPEDALPLLNSHYFIAKVNGAYVIAQIEDDGSIKYISDKDFRLKLGNMFVRVDDGHGGKKKVSAEKFWISHPNREERSEGAAGDFGSWKIQSLGRLCRSPQKNYGKAPSTASAYS